MNKEIEKLLLDFEKKLIEKIDTDSQAETLREMQAYNRGVAEGTRMIRTYLECQNNELLNYVMKEINKE